MKLKKKPIRMCAACREHKDKSELIRIVKSVDGGIQVDEDGKMDGRGAYLCRDNSCIAAAEKKKSLNRALKSEICQEIYEKLKEFANGNNG